MIVLSLHYLLGLLVMHWNSFNLKHLVIRVGGEEIAIPPITCVCTVYICMRYLFPIFEGIPVGLLGCIYNVRSV
jgi:hypothetical protein